MKVNCFGDNKNYIDNKIKKLPKELRKKLPHVFLLNIFLQ